MPAGVRQQLVDPDGEVVVPRRDRDHHPEVAVGVAQLADGQVATVDVVQQGMDRVDRLDRGDRVVDRSGQRSQGDVDKQPQGEQRILVERAIRSGLDQPQEVSPVEAVSWPVDQEQHHVAAPSTTTDEKPATTTDDGSTAVDDRPAGGCDDAAEAASEPATGESTSGTADSSAASTDTVASSSL